MPKPKEWRLKARRRCSAWRKRKKKSSNEDWKSPSDEEAEITKLKDGRTALAYKAKNAVVMETGAIVAVTTHSGAAADTTTVRSYVAEPDRGPRNWDGKPAAKQAVHGNRRRVQGARCKRLQRQRGERIERNFAHHFDTGGLDRLYVRSLENVHKKFLIQAAACNLALLLRSTYGSGKPRAAHDRATEVILMILADIKTVRDLFVSELAHFDHPTSVFANHKAAVWSYRQPKMGRLDTAC